MTALPPNMANADLLFRNARRLGANPLPLAAGEVATYARRSGWKDALAFLVLAAVVALVVVGAAVAGGGQ